MAPEIIAAIITGAVAIVIPGITLVFKSIYDRRIWKLIIGRRKAVLGKWIGTINQLINNIPTSFD